jgi:glutaredoxin
MIVIYTLPDCPRCDEVKRLLNENKVDYTTRSMDDPEALADLRFNGRFDVVAPVIENNGYYYTYEEFMNTTEE